MYTKQVSMKDLSISSYWKNKLKEENSYHDRAEWGQLIVQCSGLGDVTGLERDL